MAKDAAKDPTKKIHIPMTSKTFRDQISDRRPYNSWNDVEVRKYAPATHALSELALSSLLMTVKLVASVVWSIKANRSTLAHERKIWEPVEW